MTDESFPPYDVQSYDPDTSPESPPYCPWCDESQEYADVAHVHRFYVSRDGAASRTADNLAYVFLYDVSEMTNYEVPTWIADIEWDRDYSAGWCRNPDDAQGLSDEIPNAESALSDAGYMVTWNDGYVIERVEVLP